jgi:hypothetical protein
VATIEKRRTIMAAKLEKYCAPGVYDPPGYSQAIKVTGAQTILFLAGQVPYEMDGTVKHRGDFRGQARPIAGHRAWRTWRIAPGTRDRVALEDARRISRSGYPADAADP